jgi:hypothetical protein
MKTFLAIFTGTPAGKAAWDALDAGTRAQRERDGMAAWNRWGEDHREAIVDNGAPLGKTKRVTCDGIADIRNPMAAYTLVRAETHADAAKLFEGHPHFAIFPGDGVEVMECLPIPQG